MGIRSELIVGAIISTNDDENATIAEKFGAKIDKLHPENISNYRAGVLAVVANELMKLEEQGIKPVAARLIYGKGPIVRGNYIIESFKLFEACDIDFVFSAAECSSPMFRSFTKLPDGAHQTNAYPLIDNPHDGDRSQWCYKNLKER